MPRFTWFYLKKSSTDFFLAHIGTASNENKSVLTNDYTNTLKKDITQHQNFITHINLNPFHPMVICAIFCLKLHTSSWAIDPWFMLQRDFHVLGTILFQKKKMAHWFFFYQRRIMKSLSENSQAFQGLIIFLNTLYWAYIYVMINQNNFLNIFYTFGAQTYFLILDQHVGRMT